MKDPIHLPTPDSSPSKDPADNQSDKADAESESSCTSTEAKIKCSCRLEVRDFLFICWCGSETVSHNYKILKWLLHWIFVDLKCIYLQLLWFLLKDRGTPSPKPSSAKVAKDSTTKPKSALDALKSSPATVAVKSRGRGNFVKMN